MTDYQYLEEQNYLSEEHVETLRNRITQRIEEMAQTDQIHYSPPATEDNTWWRNLINSEYRPSTRTPLFTNPGRMVFHTTEPSPPDDENLAFGNPYARVRAPLTQHRPHQVRGMSADYTWLDEYSYSTSTRGGWADDFIVKAPFDGKVKQVVEGQKLANIHDARLSGVSYGEVLDPED